MGWKRGQSGNPGGRPFGSEKAYTEALRIVSKEEIDDPNRPGERISRLRRMADIVFEKALTGENWAIQHIAERFEGRPTQMLEHTGDAERRPTAINVWFMSAEGRAVPESGYEEEDGPKLIEAKPIEPEPEGQPSRNGKATNGHG